MNLDRHVWWISTVGVGYLLLAIPILRRPSRKLTAILLKLYILLSTAWVLAGALSTWHLIVEPWSTLTRFSLIYGLVILAVLLGMMTTYFVRGERQKTWGWLVGGGLILLGMGILDWTAFEWVAWSNVSTLALSESLSLLGWLGLSVASYLISWRAYHETQRPLHRNRLRYWMLVVAAVLAGDALFILLSFPYGELGTLLHWLGIALASVALLNYHLPDLSGIMRQMLRYVLLTLFTAATFWGGIWLAQYVLRFISSMRLALIGMAGIALLLAIFYPLLRRGLLWLLNRLLFGEGYDRERILREYSQGISNILDMERLVTVSTGIISEAMGVRRGALLVCEDIPAYKLRPVRGMGTLDVGPIVLGPDCPPIVHMLETRTPVSQYDLDMLPQFQGLLPETRTWFSALDMEMYVPILANDQLLGILMLGAKTSGDAYSAVDTALLRTLAGQTAVALKNARLVEDLKRLNAEITQLNQDLTLTNERLAILDKTKSDFISIASHELKTPLTQIKGYTDMLLEMSEGETMDAKPVRRIVQGVLKGSGRLHDVVDAMLDVSLIEQESFSIHPIPVSLGHIIGQVVGSLEKAIQERHQAVTMVGVDTLPDVIADESHLHQALRNIVINGIKFTPDQGRIDIRGRLLNGGDVVELAISDTGIGIDPEHHNLIFEKFYRVGDLNLHSTGQFKFKGAGPGLGLPIARGIIEAHGGRIWVESRGHDEETYPGSTFYITLPVNGPPREPETTSGAVTPSA